MEYKIIFFHSRAMVGNGGLTVSMWEWVRAVSELGEKVSVLYDKKEISDPSFEVVGVKLIPIRYLLWGRLRFPILFGKHINRNTVVILQSAFGFSNMVVAIITKIKKSQYILTPHGAYHAEALSRNSLLKKIWLIAEKILISKALAIHIFNDSEKEAIGVLVPGAKTIVFPTPFRMIEDYVWKGGGKYIAWFGRYDIHHKGLDILIKAYASIPEIIRLPLILHGRNSTNTSEDVKEMVVREGLGKEIFVCGPIDGADKYKFLCSAELFVMPSRLEGLSVALLEALSLNVPTITSNKMPISALLERSNACIITSLEGNNLGKILSEVLAGTICMSSYEPKRFVSKYIDNINISRDFIGRIDEILKENKQEERNK